MECYSAINWNKVLIYRYMKTLRAKKPDTDDDSTTL